MVRRALARLHFAWTLLLAAVVSVALSPVGFPSFVLWPSARTFWGWMRVWSGSILTGAGIRVVRSGSAYRGPAVVVANHQAMIDIPALLLGIDRPFVFVARREIRKIPIVGAVLHYSRCVFIDRGAAGPGLAEAAGRVAEGDAVLMFPEGTRNYGGPVRRFRSGAFRLAMAAGVPVVPVAIQGGDDVLNERRKEGRPGVVTVTVLPEVWPEPGETAGAFAARVQAVVVAALPEPDGGEDTKKPAPRERAPAGR